MYPHSQSPFNNLQVIVGLGKTGLSCVQYLVNQQANIAITDSRTTPPALREVQTRFPNIPLFLGKLNPELCAQASRLIVSPGLALTEPAIAHASACGVPVVGDVELFFNATSSPVIGITGSNGKSTVTTLVGKMAKKAGLETRVGGNLGTPVLSLLCDPVPDLYVLELSSFQLETTPSVQTCSATVLNLCEDHRDRYAHMKAYLTAKQHIYSRCQNAIVNRDDPITWQDLTLSHTLSFGLDEPEQGQFGLRRKGTCFYLAKGETLLMPTSALKVKGRHQMANALAALALGEAAGLPLSAMLEALQEFEGLTHRCQWLRQLEGVDWYNDSKATNVGATQAALMGLSSETSGKLIVIAGGVGKNADFSLLRPALDHSVRYLILMGQDAALIATALAGIVPIEHVKTLEEGVGLARKLSQAGDAVILSPACASFDMFDDFEHRGEVFMNLVAALSPVT